MAAPAIARSRELRWGLIFFFGLGHVLAALAVVEVASYPNHWILLDAFVWYQLSGLLGITAGAHRLWSHRSYRAKLPARVLMMVANCIAFQGPIYWWARDHRAHHKYVDTDADPYNFERGFFFAHMGWVFTKKHPLVAARGRQIGTNDLLQDPVVRFQARYYWVLAPLLCFGLPALYGRLVYGDWGVPFLVLGPLRWVVTLHATWCVNSVAHCVGGRPYDSAVSARESALTSIVAAGEGWHNFHHRYPYDYAAAARGPARQWNPSTLWIRLLAAIGQADRLRRVPAERRLARSGSIQPSVG